MSGSGTDPQSSAAPVMLSRAARSAVLAATFLGWMGAGMEMSLLVPATRPAIQEFLAAGPSSLPADMASRQLATSADQWLSWFIAAFLLGAAVGGLLFGWLGDRIGRTRAMGWSIVCYSLITGLSYLVTTPGQLLVLRFLACLGIGGMWPCGVALLMESVPGLSRAFLAGWIGTSANVGFVVLGVLMLWFPITRESWRWVFLLGTTPVALGVLVLAALPESPQWLADVRTRNRRTTDESVFRPPHLRRTLLGILLGTVPLLGGWASGQRLVPWAAQVAETAGRTDLVAQVQIVFASGAVAGSLLGGWFASWLGCRWSYLTISLGSLLLSLTIFLGNDPLQPTFLPLAFALGLVSTSFFGWLPYYLPMLFPVSVRAAGTGVAFNFGRIFSALALVSSTGLSAWFAGDVGRMGAATSVVYAVGIIAAWWIPEPDERK